MSRTHATPPPGKEKAFVGPRRPRRGVPVLFGTLCLLAAACSPSPGGGKGIRPNLVLISIDTLRADHMGCYGYGRDTSPFLDAVARKGMLFEAVTAQETWTLPSHASMLSSRFAAAHGVWRMDRRLPREGLPLLQEVLHRGGYRTAAFTSCQFLTKAYGFDRGFDTFRFSESPAETINRRVLEYLSRSPEEPFFLFLHYYDVHSPFTEPNPYGKSFETEISPEVNAVMVRLRALDGRKTGDLASEDRAWIVEHFPDSRPARAIRGEEDGGALITYEDVQNMAYTWLRDAGEAALAPAIGAYDNGVAYVDFHLAELFRDLRTRHGYENTVFVITGDHGEAFGRHRGLLGHGGPPYEELSHVPLILFGKGIPAGRRVSEPVAEIDIAPTLLDLAGLARPSSFQGASLLPLIRGTGRFPSRRPILSGVLEAGRVALREGPWKLVLMEKAGAARLFDLLSSEGEGLDRSGDEPDRAARLEKILRTAEKYNQRLAGQMKVETVTLTEEARTRLRELGYLK